MARIEVITRLASLIAAVECAHPTRGAGLPKDLALIIVDNVDNSDLRNPALAYPAKNSLHSARGVLYNGV
jgi:hypothetical protein